MSGSVFLANGWSVGGINSAIPGHGNRGQNNQRGRKQTHRAVSGAISRRGSHRRVVDQGFRGVIATVLALAGVRTRFQQVDYRNFRELLNASIGGRIHHWGCDTYLYDDRNRVVAIKRAARLDASGRSVPPCYFVRRAA